jgi:hypothetical protein
MTETKDGPRLWLPLNKAVNLGASIRKRQNLQNKQNKTLGIQLFSLRKTVQESTFTAICLVRDASETMKSLADSSAIVPLSPLGTIRVSFSATSASTIKGCLSKASNDFRGDTAGETAGENSQSSNPL